jgi:chromosome segregation ATPase
MSVAKPAPKAAAVVLDKDRPIAPQLLEQVQASHRKLAALEAEIAGLSLDALLDDAGAAADQRRQLVEKLHGARAEHDRLTAAYSTALDRDEEAEAEVEIAEIERQFAEYEGYAAGRESAMEAFDRATAEVEAALKRLSAAASLLQHDLPRLCRLPKDYRVDVSLASVEAIRNENAFLVGHVRSQVARVARSKRNEEAA